MTHIFSLEYMKGDIRYNRYYAYLGLFTFSMNGIVIADLKEGEKIVEPLSDRILGRTILDDFIIKGDAVVRSGSVISEEEAELIGDSGVENIRIRSILTCEAKRGCCAKCL